MYSISGKGILFGWACIYSGTHKTLLEVDQAFWQRLEQEAVYNMHHASTVPGSVVLQRESSDAGVSLTLGRPLMCCRHGSAAILPCLFQHCQELEPSSGHSQPTCSAGIMLPAYCCMPRPTDWAAQRHKGGEGPWLPRDEREETPYCPSHTLALCHQSQSIQITFFSGKKSLLEKAWRMHCPTVKLLHVLI